MVASLRFFYAFFLLSIFGKGLCQTCNTLSITVQQTTTGNVVHGQPEYKVEITNNCKCTQTDVRLECSGFNSVEHVDPALFRQDGANCIANDGQPFYFGSSIKFLYAWDNPINLVPASSQIYCP